MVDKPFLTDIKTLRERARQHIDRGQRLIEPIVAAAVRQDKLPCVGPVDRRYSSTCETLAAGVRDGTGE